MKKQIKLMQGNNLELLKQIPDNSIDSVVTDPPYGLGKERDMNIILKDWIEKGYSEIEGTGFMGKEWDAYVPQPQFWKEIFRVLKPGGHILAFFGTRTYDIGTMAIRMAGFEIRDQIMWLYGSGFPKSHNISKAISKINGENVKVGKAFVVSGNLDNNIQKNLLNGKEKEGDWKHKPTTEGAIKYEGWGTALKPANEPICLARKPLSEKSVAENVLKWKTGGINVDGCRVGSDVIKTEDRKTNSTKFRMSYDPKRTLSKEITYSNEHEGRFPANLILECICDEVIKGDVIKGNENYKWSNVDSDSDIFKGRGKYTPRTETPDIHTNPMCPCRLLDEQSGKLNKQAKCKTDDKSGWQNNYVGGDGVNPVERKLYLDEGGASRFYYQAKVSKAERNMGLDHFEEKETKGSIGLHSVGGSPTKDNNRIQKNTHPTVKPINLMTYLCRLITPEGGIVLDPFMGSGSTGIAAQLEGFRFVGMEMDEEYMKIATARIENYEKYKKFIK